MANTFSSLGALAGGIGSLAGFPGFGTIAPLVGNALDSLFGSSDASYHQSKKLMRLQQQLQDESYFARLNDERTYTTPKASLGRLMDAGLNPNLFYGEGSAWSGSSSVGNPSVSIAGRFDKSIADQQRLETALLAAKQAKENNYIDSMTQRNKAETGKLKAEEARIMNTDTREEDMHQLNKDYTEALTRFTNDRNERERVEQQMQQDMDAATRNKMQKDIDAMVRSLDLQEARDKEDARHNLQLEIIARFDAVSKRMTATAAVQQVAADVKLKSAQMEHINEITKSLRAKNVLDLHPNFMTFNLPKSVAKKIPTVMQRFLTYSSNGSVSLNLSYAAYRQINDYSKGELDRLMKQFNTEMTRQDMLNYDYDKMFDRLSVLIQGGKVAASAAVGGQIVATPAAGSVGYYGTPTYSW